MEHKDNATVVEDTVLQSSCEKICISLFHTTLNDLEGDISPRNHTLL